MSVQDREQLGIRLRLYSEAQQLDSPGAASDHGLIEDVIATAGELIATQQHDAAIALLDEARGAFPTDSGIRRYAALARGGRGEHALRLLDMLGVPPPPARLALLESLFEEARQIDPMLPDPFWDLAVLQARFRQDYAAARANLERAVELGYSHPMIPRLASLIAQGLQGAGGAAEAEPDGATQLKQLLWSLVTWPEWPADGVEMDEGELAAPPRDWPFESYRRSAQRLVRDGRIGLRAFEAAEQALAVFAGDALDYATDLLREVADELGDPAVAERATNRHLRLLATSSAALRSRATEAAVWLRRARRAARRGLALAEQSTVPIHADVQAELLLALGQTYSHPAHPEQYRLSEALRYYLPALELKIQAGNVADAARLRLLIRDMVDYLATQLIAATVGLGGIGGSLAELEAGYAATRQLDDPAFQAKIGVLLASAYSETLQPLRAEEVLEEILALPGVPQETGLEARFELASAYSESDRPADALRLQLELLEEAESTFRVIDPATFWLNLGNSRREVGELEAAREAFTRSLELVAPSGENQVSAQRAHAQALLGQLEFMLGRPRQGAALLRKADREFGVLPSLGALRFHELAARLYSDVGVRRGARRHLGRHAHLLRWHLSRSPSLPVWERLLQQRSGLDALQVAHDLQAGTPAGLRDAFVAAESAKGRLLAWLRRFHASQGAEAALEEERHRRALERVEQWVDSGPRRHVLSLFAGPKGLAVFGLGRSGELSGQWLGGIDYDVLDTDCYQPWELQVERAMEGVAAAWPLASLLTELLLERIGGWLWRGVPELAEGGDELVIIPHRMFRSLPLAHSRLPNGVRLSEAFARVAVVPSIDDFAQLLERSAATPAESPSQALVDPDGSLPFARLEGLLAAGGAKTRVLGEVTVQAVSEAFRADGLVLVSAHGDFREDNPWESVIHASDGALQILPLLESAGSHTASTVVLGACESGKTRRSASDEPLGFPSLLVQGGVDRVLAPLWKVDDFATLLFMTALFERLRQQQPLARAVAGSAAWLRELGAPAALAQLDDVLEQVTNEHPERGTAALADLEPRLGEIRAWLATVPEARPFRSPLYWAGFQLVGLP